MRRLPLEEEAIRMGSDLFLGALALDVYERSREEAERMGFRLRTLEEARKIYLQLVDLIRKSGFPIPDAEDAAEARRAIAAGLGDRILFSSGYLHHHPVLGVMALDRNSLLSRNPRTLMATKVAWVLRVIPSGKRIASQCTIVEREWIGEIVPPRIRHRILE